MKKFATLLCAVLLIISASGLYAAQSNIDIKGGIAYPEDPDKIGFDGGVSFNIGIDKFFALGLEADFTWISWDLDAGESAYGPVTLTQTESINAYSVPLLVNARLRFDQSMELGIMPYLAAGAGYGWTWVELPDETRTFSGLTWQVLGGIAFQPGEGSNMNIILEVGYRGSKHKDEDDYEIDMSGLIAHVGVRFPIGGDSDF